MIKRILKSFVYAARGLGIVWREEFNFRLEILAGAIVLATAYFFRFTYIESAFVVLAVTAILCAEILNTAIEDLCNKIEPNQNDAIRKIKDTAAAFVLIAIIGAIFLIAFAFSNHFLGSSPCEISGVCVPKTA